MADRPILFSAPMVRALLGGQKTQTRRIFKARHGFGPPVDLQRHGMGGYSGRFNDPSSWGYPYAEDGADMQLSRWPELSGFQRGDRLWVKETWGLNHYEYIRPNPIPKTRPADLEDHHIVYFATEDDCEIRLEMPRAPSIFLPRWVSRITLTVTDVRVQRLQDCSEEDARAEGCPLQAQDGREIVAPVRWYRNLWDDINDVPGKRWQDNPWVVAVSFDVRKGNIDG